MATDRFDKPPPKLERSRAPSARELALRAELIQVRHELKLLLEDLERARTSTKTLPVQSAIVTQVVAKTQLMHQGAAQQPRRD